jgi:hypothetical protein
LAALSPASAATLADAVLFLHVGIVAFVVLGTALILIGGWRRWHWVRGFKWRWLHCLCRSALGRDVRDRKASRPRALLQFKLHLAGSIVMRYPVDQ